MATLLTVKLTKGDSPNWGFRLQGGKDFGTPLVIQKVIVGSPAERAGLIAGDSVIKVNQTDVFNLRHKDAQDVLLRAGNSFDMTIQRGGSTWKPSVVPTGILSTPSPTINNISPVTRTSLAAKPSENIGAIGTGHNLSAKPFANGTLNGGPKVVNNQYNSPLKLYSEESIAETLSAQTEVLSTGALGVNFKKNEKNYDASKSAVLSLLKEEENSPKSPDHTVTSPYYASHSHAIGSRSRSPWIDTHHYNNHDHYSRSNSRQSTSTLSPRSPNTNDDQVTICTFCDRVIVGVFVRIKDKNLHVECFKCSTCGTSLKNVGYYNINNKLYCDIHAKLAARNNAPAPNLVPITVPPGGKAPANAISAALASHPYHTPAPLSPKINSYQLNNDETDETKQIIDLTLTKEPVTPIRFSNINNITPKPFGEYVSKSPLSGPKPFSSVPGPLSPSSNFNSLPRSGAPLSPVAPAPAYSPVASTEHGLRNPTPTNDNFPKKSEIFIEVKNNNFPEPYDQITITIPKANLTSTSSNSDNSSNTSAQSGSHSPRFAQDRSSRSISQTPWINNFQQQQEMMSGVDNLKIDDFLPEKPISPPAQNKINVSEKKSGDILGKTKFSQSNGNAKMGVLETDFPLIDTKPLESVKLVTQAAKMSGKVSAPAKIDNETNNVNRKNMENAKLSIPNTEKNGILNDEVPICYDCKREIVRGPFITALGKIWCPNHFICATPSCRRPLQDLGFVEEQGQLYCEYCFEQYLAPVCSKCGSKVKGDCLKAIGKSFHPECFNCVHCGKLFGNSPFFLEDGSPYCETDWNEFFTTKCFACGFPVEAGDRWVEALNNNYHSQCFNCTMCKKNLEGQSFFAKGGRPYCKTHAR
ncbi:PDZ and LIM domain protein Zasp isoform X6 [Coccinella septempunctata]|uniref:PDZ and LIM domain protein Zasp isoform X6 n=1 Tax=Coccinella septempunctata TaxID=41139 RepID=UPI001D08623F|nr:PDZ and LIM domain protein Zasp isoform X6 [Coccinella septempunctata]